MPLETEELKKLWGQKQKTAVQSNILEVCGIVFDYRKFCFIYNPRQYRTTSSTFSNVAPETLPEDVVGKRFRSSDRI